MSISTKENNDEKEGSKCLTITTLDRMTRKGITEKMPFR